MSYDLLLDLPGFDVATSGLRITVTNNADGTASVNIFDKTRTEGEYQYFVNDVLTWTEPYNGSFPVVLTINDPSQAYSFRVEYYDDGPTLVETSNTVSKVITGDTDGAAFVAYQESLGYTFGAGEADAWQNWFADNRSDGILSKIAEAAFFIFGNNNYNRSLLINRSAGSFPAGTATASSDRVTFSSSGYFSFVRTLAGMGLTSSGHGSFVIFPTSISDNSGSDIGAVGGGGETRQACRNTGTLGYFRMGGTTDGTNSFEAVNVTSYTAAGMWVSSRSSSSVAVVKYYDWTTISTVASTSGFSGTTFPTNTLAPYVGGVNTSGSLTQPTNRPYTGAGQTLDLSSAEIDLLMVNTETLLVALGKII
jgi:hypothetical protein